MKADVIKYKFSGGEIIVMARDETYIVPRQNINYISK
jgi:hypothetical protein